MKQNWKFWLGLGLVVGFHGCLFLIKAGRDPLWFQQDNYLGYAEAIVKGLRTGVVEFSAGWLFPGLAWLLYVLSWLTGDLISSGVVLMGVSLIGIYYLSYLMLKDWYYALIVTLFPPIVLEQTSKLSTESIVMFLLIFSYYLFSKKKYLLMSGLLGLATVVRPISGCLWLGLGLSLIKARKWKSLIASGGVILAFLLLLAGFNWFYLNSNIWHQVRQYQTLGPVTMPITQLVKDIIRAVDWGYWRILISGLGYIGLSLSLVIKTVKRKGDLLSQGDGLMVKTWAGLTLIYVLTVGPVPMLEEFRRYIAVLFPLILVVNFKALEKSKLFRWGAAMLSLVAFL